MDSEDRKTRYKAIPEWEKAEGIFIVNPEVMFYSSMRNTKDILVKLYNEFLYYLIDYTTINVIINDKLIDVDTSIPFEEVKVLNLPSVKNIWIRDWAPILTKDETGNTTAIKFIYSPTYLNKSESKSCDKAGRLLAHQLKIPIVEVPLILDGGNFAYNGEGIGIVSNRVIGDNENYSIKEIKDIFSQYLGIDKLIFVPIEPGDETGHTDGLLRFIDNKTLVVGSYPEDYKIGDCLIPCQELKDSRKFMNNLVSLLQNELGKKYKIVRVTNSIPRNPDKQNDVAPAFGNYINFIRLGKNILLPQFKIPEDTDAELVFKNNFKNLEIIPVHINGIKELSYQGGVLNCISWVRY